ncbi:MAG: ABC transporter permease subunit [Verrucomicrobiota bacterium]
MAEKERNNVNGFGRQLNGELYRMFARRRTHIGFLLFLLIEGLALYFFQKPGAQRFFEEMLTRNGHAFEYYFSALTLALVLLVASVFVLGMLFLALVAGDIVAKEFEDGTLRMVLSRPVSRVRLLSVKWISCSIYTGVLILFLGVTAVVMGIFERGWGGGFFAFIPEKGVFAVYDWWPGMGRYFFALALLSISMNTVTSVAFCLSCLRIKPAAATILTAAVFITDWILALLPPLADYRDWFLTPKLDDWVYALSEIVPWWGLVRSYAIIAGIQVTSFVVGWVIFEMRDLKS